MKARSPTASVVIPTRDRPNALARCIEALAGQEHPADDFEVVVVDDGGRTPLDAVVDPFRSRVDVTLVRWARSRGPGSARNEGCRNARAGLILFIDDDCRPEAGWVAAMLRAHRQRPGAAFGGHTALDLPENPFSTASQTLVDYLYAYYNSDPTDSRFFTTSNFAIPRRLLLDVGGFDESIPVNCAEDRELCYRLAHLGHPLVYVPEAIVGHAHPLSLRSFCTQHFTYGRGAVHFRRLLHARSAEPFGIEPPGFYAGMLRHAYDAGGNGTPGPLVAGLVLLSQVANALGYLTEKIGPVTSR